ncbi:hypothetical protein J3A83DRAFT_4368962 [Scleroderma citrinum]
MATVTVTPIVSVMRSLGIALLVLAGQAHSLTIDVDGSVGTISADNFLNVADARLLSDCQSQCTSATSAIQNCNGDDLCLCGPETVTAITACQQCMFNDLISTLSQSTDPRAGSATALTAYGTACLAAVNITIPPQLITLQLPSNWDGPYGVSLSEPATVLTIAVGALLGGSAILLFSNM